MSTPLLVAYNIRTYMYYLVDSELMASVFYAISSPSSLHPSLPSPLFPFPSLPFPLLPFPPSLPPSPLLLSLLSLQVCGVCGRPQHARGGDLRCPASH